MVIGSRGVGTARNCKILKTRMDRAARNLK